MSKYIYFIIIIFIFFSFAFFYEFLAVMLPGLLSFTILSEYFSAVLIPILLLVVVLPLLPRTGSIIKVQSFLKSLPFPKRPPFLTVLRTWVNIYTSICILAVDFHVFPRRLAKAESYGTGLMDIGVGMFIINHGMVVKETHLDSVSISRYLKYLSRYIVSSRVWVFILLGLLRLLSVKSTDYQEHVSEYGVHWNFFFTIAAVKVRGLLLFIDTVSAQCMLLFLDIFYSSTTISSMHSFQI